MHDIGLPIVGVRGDGGGGDGNPLASPLAACFHALGMPRPWGATETLLSTPQASCAPLSFNPLESEGPEGARGAWQCLSLFQMSPALPAALGPGVLGLGLRSKL